ncbi:MAG: hypothetical protein V4754_07430 [Pseudomonadota bacterium]
MGVLQEVIQEATEKHSDVPRMLRLCLLLGKRLGHLPLTAWVQHELEGYPQDAALPSYREFRCINNGLFENLAHRRTLEIPLGFLPDNLRERYRNIKIRDNVGELAHLLESVAQGDGRLQVPWPPELTLLHLQKIAQGAHCIKAWSEISVAELAGALDQIKSRVLGFALDIEKEAPNAGEISGTNRLLKEEKLTQIFNTNINGTVQNLANGSRDFNQSVTTGLQTADLPSLLAHLRDNGVPENEVTSLNDAIEADKKEGKVAAVTAWIGGLVSRAATGALAIGLDKVTTVIVPAVKGYLGLP